MARHAEIKIGDYTVPLIGIPEDAVLFECDLCHDFFNIQELELNADGKCFYCKECKIYPTK